MKKINIRENKLKILLSQMLKETAMTYPTFGNGSNTIYYKPHIEALGKITNLHNDRYKDYELDEAWKEWQKVNYNKDSQEYLIYLSL